MILVADDNPTFRGLVRTILEKRGFRVIEARSGVESVALLTANTGEIRAVVLDMLMPEIDGRETLSVLRRMSPSLPVLTMSGDPERAPVTSDSVTMFIRKPFGAAALVSALRALLEHWSK
jgi:CheY-like chemotaxis protein